MSDTGAAMVRICRESTWATSIDIGLAFGITDRQVRRICSGVSRRPVSESMLDDEGEPIPAQVLEREPIRCPECGAKALPSVANPGLCLRCSLFGDNPKRAA